VTISRISSAAAATSSVTLGTHAAGDLLMAFSFNDGATTVPALPSGWINHGTVSGSLTAYRIGYKIAASSSETSGTWTSADGLIVVVYRGGTGCIVQPGFANGNSGTSTTLRYSAFAAANDREGAADRWFAGFAAMRLDTNAIENPPTNMSFVVGQVGTGWEMAWHDSNATLTSWPNTDVTVATSAFWRTGVIQLYEQDHQQTGGGGSGSAFLPRGYDGGYRS